MKNLEYIKEGKAKKGVSFLVLMDFSEASYIALKYAITMAKLVKGNVHVLHVANPKKIVDTDNPVAALRAIEIETTKIKNKLNSIIEIISAEDIFASSYYSIGNIIKELENHINQVNPDIVVVGKKKNSAKFSGKLSDYLRNKYSNSFLIVDEESEFKTDSKIAFGCNSGMLNKYDPDIIFELDKHTKTTLILLNICKNTEFTEKIDIPSTWKSSNGKARSILCESQESSTVVGGLVEHIADKNIELLCIGRGKPRGFFQNLFYSQGTTMSEIINKVNIPILVMRYNSKKEGAKI
jgi:nucleotide-binding universal stress UspA family protein